MSEGTDVKAGSGHGLCPKTDGPKLTEDNGPYAVSDITFKFIGTELMVDCFCDENPNICTRKPTARETARARALGIIK